MHRDRLTKNDVVGTTYLYLSKIAASGGEVEGKSLEDQNETGLKASRKEGAEVLQQ